MFVVTGGALLLGHYFTNQRLTGKDERTRANGHRLCGCFGGWFRAGGSVDTGDISFGGNDNGGIDAWDAVGVWRLGSLICCRYR